MDGNMTLLQYLQHKFSEAHPGGMDDADQAFVRFGLDFLAANPTTEMLYVNGIHGLRMADGTLVTICPTPRFVEEGGMQDSNSVAVTRGS